MKKISMMTVAVLSLVLLSGCANRIAKTPAVMTYDGSNLDYSKIENLKSAKVCKKLSESSGDTTIVAAAKQGGISKIKHVDTSAEYSTFLFINYGFKNCVTVYGL